MKRFYRCFLISFLLLLVYTDVLTAQTESITAKWASRAEDVYPLSIPPYGDMAVDQAGNSYYLGTIRGQFKDDGTIYGYYGEEDIYLVKYDPAGNQLWEKYIGGEWFDAGMSVAVDQQQNVLITGNFSFEVTYDTGKTIFAGDTHPYLIKYSSEGDALWVKILIDQYETRGNSVAIDSDDNIVVTGNISQTDFRDPDMFLQKYNPGGDLLWQKIIRSPVSDDATGVAVNRDNEIYISGYSADSLNFSENSPADLFVSKFSSEGNLIWSKYFRDSVVLGNTDISIDNDGNILLAALFSGSFTLGNVMVQSVGERDLFIAKMDSSGQPLWIKYGWPLARVHKVSITVDSSGNAAAAGSNRFIRLSPDGEEISAYQLDTCSISGISFTPSGNLAISGAYDNHLSIGSFELISDYLYKIFLAEIYIPQFTKGSEVLDFGVVPAGDSTDKSVVIHNPGEAPLLIRSFTLTGADSEYFDVNGQDSFTISSSDSASVSISFFPDTPGTYNAELNIFSDAAEGKYKVLLKGSSSYYVLKYSAEIIQFDSAAAGKQTEDTLRIYNPGPAVILIDSIVVDEAGSSDFSIKEAVYPDTLSAGTERKILINFTPSDSGLQTSALIIYSSSETSPDTIPMEGYSTGPVTFADRPEKKYEYVLYQNYPNPFNPLTVISWQLSAESYVTLKIYDVLGREVSTLISKNLNSGVHELNFNAADLNTGVYFYKLEASGKDGSKYISTKKMVVVK